MRIILLRGLGRDQLHWRPLIAQLKTRSKDLIIETPDLLGAGILFNEKSPTNISEYISALDRQISQDHQPTILVGLSMGGMIALEWAKQKTHFFDRVVLINSSSRLNYFFQRLRLFQVLSFPSIFLGRTISERENGIYRLTCNNGAIDENTLYDWINIQLLHPVTKINQLRQVLAAAKFVPPHKADIPPIHVLYSNADRLVSPSCSKRLIKHYDASFDNHDWAGHDLVQDDPKWVAEKLVQQTKQLSVDDYKSATAPTMATSPHNEPRIV